MTYEHHIKDYLVLAKKLDSQELSGVDQRLHLQQGLKSRQRSFSVLSWWMKAIQYLPYLISTTQLKTAIAEQEERLARIEHRRTRALNTLVLEVGRDLMVSGAAYPRLAELESNYASLLQITRAIEEVRQAGVDALNGIDLAISALSNSQVVEMADAVTDNSAISMLSTGMNYSASSAVEAATSGTRRFYRKLQEHPRTVADIQHGLAPELLDLSFDLLFGGSLDLLGSIISVGALRDTESKLWDLHSTVAMALDPISANLRNLHSNLHRLEAETLAFKNSWRVQVKPILDHHGIPVPAGYDFVLNDLFAPSVASKLGSAGNA